MCSPLLLSLASLLGSFHRSRSHSWVWVLFRRSAGHTVRELHKEELLSARQAEVLQQVHQRRLLLFGEVCPAGASARQSSTDRRSVLCTWQHNNHKHINTRTDSRKLHCSHVDCNELLVNRHVMWHCCRGMVGFSHVLLDWHRGNWMGCSLSSLHRSGSSMNWKYNK